MSKRKSESPLRAYKRMVKRDALAQNRADGCTCPNIDVAVTEDRANDRFTVTTTGHSDTCAAVVKGSLPVSDTATPGAATEAALDIVESKLWTP